LSNLSSGQTGAYEKITRYATVNFTKLLGINLSVGNLHQE